MARDEPTEAIIKREIAAARRILREDKVLASHAALSERIDKHFPAAEPPADPSNPPPPPRKDEPADPPPKTSLWWGTSE
jgi:hypothetical protein